jgi:hypothetical protein
VRRGDRAPTADEPAACHSSCLSSAHGLSPPAAPLGDKGTSDPIGRQRNRRLLSKFERIVVRGMPVHTRSRRLHVAAHYVQAVADHGAR